jgi:predicted phosphodiesterase
MASLRGLLLSDVHTEHMTDEEIEKIFNLLFGDGILQKVDMVFLCGDIGTVTEKQKLIKFLTLLSVAAGGKTPPSVSHKTRSSPKLQQVSAKTQSLSTFPVLNTIDAPLIFWVPGNHEYRGVTDSSVDNEFEEIASKSSTTEKIILLNKKKVNLFFEKENRNITILGATLWSDLSKFSCNFHMRDTHMGVVERQKLFEKNKKFIIKNLKKENNIIVLTHHPPYIPNRDKEEIEYEGKKDTPYVPLTFNHNHLHHYYGTDNVDLNSVIGKAMFWCHGHLHEQSVKKLNGTTIFSNSLGYKKENLPIKRLIITF